MIKWRNEARVATPVKFLAWFGLGMFAVLAFAIGLGVGAFLSILGER